MSYYTKQLKRQTVGKTIEIGSVTGDYRTLHFYDFAWQGRACSAKEDTRRDRIRDRVSKTQETEFEENGDLYYCDTDLSSDEGRTAIERCLEIKVYRCEIRHNAKGRSLNTFGVGLIDDGVDSGTFEGYARKQGGRWVLRRCTAGEYLEHYGAETFDDLPEEESAWDVQVGIRRRFAKRFPKLANDDKTVYPSFESKEQGIAWIARHSVVLGKQLWISKSIRDVQGNQGGVRYSRQSAEWIVEEKCPILVECYDTQGIRHG